MGYSASCLCCWAADGKLLQYVLVQKPLYLLLFEFQFLRSVSHWSGTSNKQPFCNNQGPNVRLVWNESLCCRCCRLTGIMKCAGSVSFRRCFVTLQLYRTITISTFVRLRYWSVAAIATRPFRFGWSVAHLKCLFKMISPVLMGILEVHFASWWSPNICTDSLFCPSAFFFLLDLYLKGQWWIYSLLRLFLGVCFPCRYLSLSVVYPIKCVTIFALLLEMISTREK